MSENVDKGTVTIIDNILIRDPDTTEVILHRRGHIPPRPRPATIIRDHDTGLPIDPMPIQEEYSNRDDD